MVRTAAVPMRVLGAGPKLTGTAAHVVLAGGSVRSLKSRWPPCPCGSSVSLSRAASLGIVRNDVDQARAQAKALSLSQELEDPHLIAMSLEVFAALLAGGLSDGAARSWGAAEEIFERVTGSLPPPVRSIRDRYIEPGFVLVAKCLLRVSGMNDLQVQEFLERVEIAIVVKKRM